MKLSIQIGGSFADDLDDEDIDALKEALEEDCRMYYGGQGVFVEVTKE